MQVICRVKAPFSLCGDREEFAIAKKLQRCRDFCFRDGRIVPTGRFHDGWIAPTDGYRKGGGSPQRGKSRRRAYSRRQRGQQRLGPLIGRSGPRALPDRVGRQPVCRGVCRGLDGAASLGLEATGGGGRGSGSPEEGGVPVPTAAAKLAAGAL